MSCRFSSWPHNLYGSSLRLHRTVDTIGLVESAQLAANKKIDRKKATWDATDRCCTADNQSARSRVHRKHTEFIREDHLPSVSVSGNH